MNRDNVLARLREIRQLNLGLYREMAGHVTVAELQEMGFKERRPGDPDSTMLLIEAALREEPAAARFLLGRILRNDLKIVSLTVELMETVR